MYKYKKTHSFFTFPVVFVPVAIKEETKPLKNLLFVLEDDDTIQCSHLSEEVLSLDTSENEHIEDIDLPPSQIDFDDTNAPVISAPITTGNSQNSSCSNSKETQSQSMATDAVQFIHLLGKKQTTNETSKPSEREKAPQPLEHLGGQQLECEMEPSFCAIPNAQRFPSTFEESVTTEIAGIQIPKASLAKKKHPQPPSMAAVNKKKAPSKPLKSSDVVPQLAHPLRALPVVTVNVLKQIESSADAEQQNQIQPNVFLEVDEEILPDDFVPGHSSTQDKHQSKNDAVQLQIQPSPPSLQVSQELSTDKTIFNNSSLLRAIDHNYNKADENANKAKTPDSRTNSTDTAESREKPSKVTTAIASPVCNIPLPSVTRKIILYRNFLEFHYFQFLTPEQVSKYELATTNYYSQYLEATIHSGTLKTKLLSDSFFELFPQWSPALRADFLIVLNDLKEFHFSRFSRPLKNCDLRNNIIYELLSSASPFCKAQLMYDEHNSEFCSLKPGWKTCYSNSHMRKPFQPLTKAIQPNILNALSTLKKALRNQSAESTEFVRK